MQQCEPDVGPVFARGDGKFDRGVSKILLWISDNLLFGQIFAEKLHENEDIWTEMSKGFALLNFYYVDPPLRVTIDFLRHCI